MADGVDRVGDLYGFLRDVMICLSLCGRRVRKAALYVKEIWSHYTASGQQKIFSPTEGGRAERRRVYRSVSASAGVEPALYERFIYINALRKAGLK